MNTALKLENIYKIFKIPQERRDTLKEHVIHFRKKIRYNDLHALKNVNLSINKGDFIGIIGRNGSGKSTLLKIIANIYIPTKGTLTINGSISPFLELGVGFNGELSARENLYLNGVILGLSRNEIDKKYKEMVQFAELEDFMEMKLKNFSSGMQVRLAFTIASSVNSDIYLCDEVLAVGDAPFQKKCLSTFKKLKKEGKTIIFVSHDLDTIDQFCDKTAFLDNGELKYFGETDSVIQKYKESI